MSLFANKTSGQQYLKTLRENTPCYTKFTDDYLWNLIQYHPEASRKRVDEVDTFEYILPSIGSIPVLRVNYRDNSSDTISINACLQNYFGKYHKNTAAMESFRKAVFDTKRKDFLKHMKEKRCFLCSSVHDICVDHYPIPFIAIVDDFFQNSEISWKDIVPTKNNIEHNVKFRQLWIDFHDEKASFRLLCRSCNSSLGANGYKSYKT